MPINQEKSPIYMILLEDRHCSRDYKSSLKPTCAVKPVKNAKECV